MDRTAILVALIGAAVSSIAAFFGYRRSKVVDATSAQSGVASNHRAGTQQVIEGLNDLLDQFQEENGRLRAEADIRATRIEALTLEVARLRKRYGDNGDTPNPPNKIL